MRELGGYRGDAADQQLAGGLLRARDFQVEVVVAAVGGGPRETPPIRRLYACSLSSGAREMQVNVTSRAFRWGTAPLKVSAADEHTGQPAVYAGPNMKW